ncbi:MAG: CHAP domain-containing protein [Oscillospiraceae bacterium]|jgi:hypothetical protein|nr:CHAP domain-containing protein [Oscillospiraceae bacterium]
MNTAAETLLKVALGFEGVYENPKNSNKVIFNTHYYGSEVSGEKYPWCAVYVWDVFRIAGLSHLYYGGKKTASTTAILTYAKQNGLFVQKSEQFLPGDIIIFNWSNRTDFAEHVGIVLEESGGIVQTVEGNSGTTPDANGGAVLRRARAKDVTVLGAYRPKYPEAVPAFSEIKEGEANVTIEEFAQLMEQYQRKNAEGDGYSPWAKNAAEYCLKNGIVMGDGSGNYGWHSFVTKEEVAAMLMRVRG